jgi:hypothetical protein
MYLISLETLSSSAIAYTADFHEGRLFSYYVSINSMVAHPPPRAFVGHSQLYLFPEPGICFLQVSPRVGNLLEAKKSNIYRLSRHLAVL